MQSQAHAKESQKQRLAQALKRNMARRKAVSKELKAEEPPALAPVEIFVDDDDDVTSPTGCCGGCR